MQIGSGKEEIETPALLIDLDILEKNIKTMADYYNGKKGAALLPHQKGHRLPAIGRKQIRAGAKGVSMTSLGLAEFYVNSGIDNILITSEVSGSSKIRRLCSLSKHSNITVGVDDLTNVKQLSKLAVANNGKIKVAVELYMGRGSAGVKLERTNSFVKEMKKFRGVDFRGFWWHEGQVTPVRGFDDRKRMVFELMDRVKTVVDETEDAGVDVEMLSGGYTSTWNITPEYHGLTEVGVQAGSYVFSDWVSHLTEGLGVFDYALTILTTCISRPTPDEAIFDFGINSCPVESGEDYTRLVGPKFKSLEDVARVVEREEIGSAIFAHSNSKVKVGDMFELIPCHSDTTAELHEKYYGMRNGEVEVVWQNHGRGLF